jgi:hypothetical protein
MPLKALLACAALLGALAPARAASREALSPREHQTLLAAWTSALASLDSGKDLAAFIARQPVEIRTDQRLRGEGLYEDGRVFIHQGKLLYRIDEAERAGLAGDAAIEAAAWDSLHILAHELEHARTRHALELALGTPYDYVDRDDELLSFAREVRIVKEIARARPEVESRRRYADADMSRFMRGQGPDSLPEFEEFIARSFSHAPQLRHNDRAALLEWARGERAYWERDRDKKLAEASHPALGELIKEAHRRDALTSDVQVGRLRRVEALCHEPTRFSIAKDYFTRRHGELEASWPRWTQP